MPVMIWDHVSPINGAPAEDVHDIFGITATTITVLIGAAPPADVEIIQPSDPATGQPWANVTAATTWAHATENYIPPPPPEPPAPEVPPTVESLQAQLTALHAVVDDLLLWSMNQPT